MRSCKMSVCQGRGGLVKVLHATNIVSHHQLPLARRIADLVGSENFRFVATQPPSGERRRLGWTQDDDAPWILRAGESSADRDVAQRWWDEADVVLCGERTLTQFRDRLHKGQLVFYMSERWWKPPIGMARLLHPRFLSMALAFRALASSPRFHFLAVGGFAASDMARWAPFPNRMWKWGYFSPEPGEDVMQDRDRNVFEILWAGRMLHWKRVDTLLRGFSIVAHEAPSAHLTLVGSGPREKSLRHLAARLGLRERVTFRPSVPAQEVRRFMQRAQVYVLPSTGQEGWGAVLNEAMSEGCAVVASQQTGAARSLLLDGENGWLFRAGDWQELGHILCSIRANPERRRAVAEAGRRTVIELWSSGTAASRFVAVCQALLVGSELPFYCSGPMSKAGT